MPLNQLNNLPDKIYCKKKISQTNSLEMTGFCLQNIMAIVIGLMLYFLFSIFIAVLSTIGMFFIVNRYFVNEKDTVKILEIILQRISGEISLSFFDAEEKILKEQLYFPLKYDSWYYVEITETNSIYEKDKYRYYKVIFLKTSLGEEIAFISGPYEKFRQVIGWMKREYSLTAEIPNYGCSDIDQLLKGIKEASIDFENQKNS